MALLSSQKTRFFDTAGSAPATPITVDVYLEMDVADAVGTALTNTILNNGTHGGVNGVTGWFAGSVPVSGFNVGAAQINALSPIVIGGTTFPIGSTSKSLSLADTLNFTIAEFGFPPVTPKATVAGMIHLGQPNISPSGDLYDLITLNGDATANIVMQLNNGNAGGSGVYGMLIETDASGTIHSSTITVTPNTTYWYSLRADFGTGIASLQLFDSVTKASVGSVTCAQKTAQNVQILRVGNNEVGSDAGTTWFQHLVIEYTTAPQPLGP